MLAESRGAAHELQEARPFASVSRYDGFLQESGRGVVCPAQFAPDGDRRAADLLELADAPGRCPGLYAFRRRFGIEAFQIGVEAVAVDVLGDVFGDVASGGALAPVDGHCLEAVLVRAGFVAVFLQGIVGHDFIDGGLVPGFHEQQKMPVRCTVVLRFGNPEAIDRDTEPLQPGADACPHLAQVALGLVGPGAVVLRIGHAVLRENRMHF